MVKCLVSIEMQAARLSNVEASMIHMKQMSIPIDRYVVQRSVGGVKTMNGKMLGRNKDTGRLACHDNVSSDSDLYITRKMIRSREKR
jgi:hypothetical protein